MPRARPKAGPPSKRTLAAARNGSLSALELVHAGLPEHYSIEVLDTLLLQLKLGGLTEEDRRDLYQAFHIKARHISLADLQQTDKINAATLAILSMVFFPAFLENHPELRKKTVQKVVKAFPDLATWMLWSLGYGPDRKPAGHPEFQALDLEVDGKGDGAKKTGNACITVVSHALELDVRLKERTIQLDTAVELMLVLWMKTHKGDPCIGKSASTPGMPPDNLIKCMHSFIMGNSGGVLAAITQQRVCTIDAFVAQTLRMVRIVIDRNKTWEHSRHVTEETYDIPTVGLLVEIANELVRDPRVREPFFKRGGVTLYAKCTMLVRFRIDMDRNYGYLPHTTHWMSHVLEWSVSSSGYLISNISAMVKEGILAVIKDSFRFPCGHGGLKGPKPSPTSAPGLATSRPRTSAELQRDYLSGNVDPCTAGPAENAAFMISTLLQHLDWPRFLPNFEYQASQTPTSNLVKENDERAILYLALTEEIDKRSKFFKKKNWVRMCDNLDNCRGVQSQRPSTVKQQTCSRCHSVVYCSRECQKRDWDRRHREECAHAFALHIDRMHGDECYSHHTKAFQLSVLLDSLGGVFHSRASDSHSVEVDAAQIWVLDATKQTPPTNLTLSDWSLQHAKSMPKHLKPRLDDMIAMWELSHTPVPQIKGEFSVARNRTPLRLFDARYQYGQLVLHLLFIARELETPVRIGDSSFQYEAAASLVFTVDRLENEHGQEVPTHSETFRISKGPQGLSARAPCIGRTFSFWVGNWKLVCIIILIAVFFAWISG